MYSAFINLGFNSIAAAQDSIPAIFYAQKGKPSSAIEVYGTNLNDIIVLGTELTTCLTAWILNNNNNTSFDIHPNPTTGAFTVKGTGEIQVYDLFGRLVLRTNKREIDMSDFPKGIYIVSTGLAVRKLVLH